MTPGAFIRRLAGPLEKPLCSAYRRCFIDLSGCVEQMLDAIPQAASVIDVGGGDGQFVNEVVLRRPDLRVTMIDLKPDIGTFVEPDLRERVDMHACTSLANYRSEGGRSADVVLVCDVIHHVPVGERDRFVQDCASVLNPGGVLIVKDCEPVGLTSWAALMLDRYVTGDRHVTQIGVRAMVELLTKWGFTDSGRLLSAKHAPNYAVAFRRG